MNRIVDRIARAWRPYAIPNLTQGIVFAQVIPYLFAMSAEVDLSVLSLIPGKVMQGEVWRLVTFVVSPPGGSPLWALIAWYVFWLMGTALEGHWGTARYNLYLFVAWLATVAAAFLAPLILGQFGWLLPADNEFIGLSVFLAFAFLFPDFEFLLFFILPVKVKWLGWFTWAGIAITFVAGNWHTRMMALASVANFLLFFGPDLWVAVRYRQKRVGRRLENLREEQRVYHRCSTCGVTEKDDPRMDFRFCSQCAGDREYCAEHLRDHEHVGEE